MSDKMRWRWGDTNPVVAAVDSATEICIGDLVWQDTDDAKPASDQSDQGDDASNQEEFAANFLGVAMQRSRAGDTTPIRVATTGVFEYACASSSFELGDPIGPDENTAGDALLDQQVVAVDTPGRAVGRVAKRESAAATTVLVDIRSTIMTGGVEGTSYSGG